MNPFESAMSLQCQFHLIGVVLRFLLSLYNTCEHLKIFYSDTCVPEMAFGTVLLATYSINTPFQKRVEALLRCVFKRMPSFLDECLQLSKEFRSGE
jgi:hypothetical protein